MDLPRPDAPKTSPTSALLPPPRRYYFATRYSSHPHILECPEGPMPWDDGALEWKGARLSWSAASGGEWLDHRIEPVAA